MYVCIRTSSSSTTTASAHQNQCKITWRQKVGRFQQDVCIIRTGRVIVGRRNRGTEVNHVGQFWNFRESRNRLSQLIAGSIVCRNVVSWYARRRYRLSAVISAGYQLSVTSVPVRTVERNVRQKTPRRDAAPVILLFIKRGGHLACLLYRA